MNVLVPHKVGRTVRRGIHEDPDLFQFMESLAS